MLDVQPQLEIADVKVHFGGVRAVDGVSFNIRPGALFGIVGPNGSGKTTLVNAVTGLVPLTSGAITFAGQEITAESPPARARRGMRRTFQAIRLIHRLTVLQNVMLGADEGDKVLRSLFQPVRAYRANAKSRVAAMEALDRVGLADLADAYPDALPYGYQRRVEIARALAAHPTLLLLDEPVAGMSSEERAEMAEMFLGFQRDGLTQVLIEHDLNMVTSITDHIVVMDFGKIIASGSPDEVTRLSNVREAYLGRR